LLASALVLTAAVASLFGPEPVQRAVGSVWFLLGAALVTVSSLLAGVLALRRGSWPGAIQHLGLVIAVAGIGVNQRAAHNGYLYLEQAAGPGNFCLSQDLRRIEELPVAVALDSVGSLAAKAFRPAPLVWLTAGSAGSLPVTYNRPLPVAGRRLLLARIVEPGFLQEYELAVGPDTYLLQHNQITEPVPGLRLWSFAYDAAAGKVGLVLGKEERWFAAGDSAAVAGTAVRVLETTFAANAGAIFIVNDVRYRLIVFLGFGLMLLGLVPPLFRKESR
jgi:hypothetical protein